MSNWAEAIMVVCRWCGRRERSGERHGVHEDGKHPTCYTVNGDRIEPVHD